MIIIHVKDVDFLLMVFAYAFSLIVDAGAYGHFKDVQSLKRYLLASFTVKQILFI